ncbi:MAG: hypothetical protein R3C11_28990 [Planctomycetaceae bacterium]
MDNNTSKIESSPSFTGVGSSIDWNSNFRPITLLVELPFWLLIPEHNFEVELDGFSTTIRVINDGVELQHGHRFSSTRVDTLAIGPRDEIPKIGIPISHAIGGVIFRNTRTLLQFQSQILDDALKALFEVEPNRRNSANFYFSCFATGHIPIINKLINAYRHSSTDPYAYELSSWDVPLWFINDFDPPIPISLNFYLTNDCFPEFETRNHSRDSEQLISEQYHAANTSEIESRLQTAEIPGEIELLDGWSQFHSGRFGDAVRSFVTAIEIIFEHKITQLLKCKCFSDEDIKCELEKTRNNFDRRIEQYCILSRRRLPGPTLNEIPWLNGLHFWDEIRSTRSLRHQIVHHGHRMNQNYHGLMQRVAETTSWLFDWLTDEDFEFRRSRNSTFFYGTRLSSIIFHTSFVDGKVLVTGPQELLRTTSEDNHFSPDKKLGIYFYEIQFIRSLSCNDESGKDIELFLKMSLVTLGTDEPDDSPYEIHECEHLERFRLTLNNHLISIFILDTPDYFSSSHLQAIVSSLNYIKEPFDNVWILINDQNDQNWSNRRLSISLSCNTIECDHTITLIGAAELMRMVNGFNEYGWSREAIMNTFLEGGIQCTAPPHSQYLGNIYHYWDKKSIVGVEMVNDYKIGVGDILAIKLLDGYKQISLKSFQIDEDLRLTFPTTHARCELRVGSEVYLLNEQLSFEQYDDVSES